MKYIYLFMLILSLSACHNFVSKRHEPPHYEKLADRITAATAQKIEAETGLSLFGIGGGMMDHVRMMAMSFECFGEITMEQGRELVIYCVNEYLSAINACEELRPHLIHYPFTPKDIRIKIFICKQDHREVPIGSLAVVGMVKGILDYDIKQSGSPSIRQIHEESYEEALKILETGSPIDKIRKNSRSIKRV
jgi:hypothetical protein